MVEGGDHCGIQQLPEQTGGRDNLNENARDNLKEPKPSRSTRGLDGLRRGSRALAQLRGEPQHQNARLVAEMT